MSHKIAHQSIQYLQVVADQPTKRPSGIKTFTLREHSDRTKYSVQESFLKSQ